jgi:hypothetical protein
MLMLRHVLGFLLLLVGTANAATLRVSAEPPLSAERLGDALRSYLDADEVVVAPPDSPSPGTAEPGVVMVTLRRLQAAADDAEVVLKDGEETIFARLPGAMRIEDLYRAAALKVQALLQRRAGIAQPADSVGDRATWPDHATRDRLFFGTGLAYMLGSDGLERGGLRLGAGVRFARRWQLGLGAYLEPLRSTQVQDIDVSTWELPIGLSLGFDWHQGSWLGRIDAVGHATLRRISVEAPGMVSSSDTAVSPRAGAAIGFGAAIGSRLRAEAQASLLAVIADTRYRVDGQVVYPAERLVFLLELGLTFGVL